MREHIRKHAWNKEFKPAEEPMVEEEAMESESESEGSCSLSDRNSSLGENDELRLY